MSIKGLSPSETESLRAALLKRESSNNYSAVNQFGFIGGYQMGSMALEDIGLVKKGVGKMGNAALNNPANWNIPGGKAAFLRDTGMQDKAFVDFANKNVRYLKDVIKPDTPPGDLAGYLAAAHLKGAGGARALSRGKVTADANGTKTTEYFKIGKTAVTGTDGSLPVAIIPSPGGPAQRALAAKTVQQGATKLIPSPINSYTVAVPPAVDEVKVPIPNPLSQFSSFNCIITLSALSASHVNSPEETYKQGNLGEIILRSGGGNASNRVQTAYVSDANPEGKFEYFIDDVSIDAVVGFANSTQGTNATTITFKVMEPYSMGVFFQSLQLAAMKVAKEPEKINYVECPYLLTLEFIGHTPDGTSNIIPNTTRHIPIKFNNSTMQVTASGCVYECEARPFNEVAFLDSYNTIKTDAGISGSTVGELLQFGENSLQQIINEELRVRAQADETNSDTVADEVVILFPNYTAPVSATPGEPTEDEAKATTKPGTANANNANVNRKLSIARPGKQLIQAPESMGEIGRSSLGFTVERGGAGPSVQEAEAFNAEQNRISRNKMVYSANSRLFQFPQGSTIVNAITEVLLVSEYCKKTATGKSIGNTDESGMIPWFRIETQVYILESKDGNVGKGRAPKLIVYLVVPYKVHKSRLDPITETPEGYELLKKRAVKNYDYIYTGSNTEVLDFNINLQFAFFNNLSQIRGTDGAATAIQTQDGAVVNKDPTLQAVSTENKGNTGDLGNGTAAMGAPVSRNPGQGGAVAADDARAIIAKTFHKALLNSPADLITGELSILGDPYYIVDSGMGNFNNSGATPSTRITPTGAMDYQTGEVHILLNFRTPIDINANSGTYDFGNTVDLQGFSGLYQVLTASNRISGGKFTQALTIVRKQKQSEVAAVAAPEAAGTENQSAAETNKMNAAANTGASQAAYTNKVNTEIGTTKTFGRVVGGL